MSTEKNLVIVQTLSHVFLGEEDPNQDLPTVLHNAICATMQPIERDGAYGVAVNALPFGLAMDRMGTVRINERQIIAWTYVSDLSENDQATVKDFTGRMDKVDDARRMQAAGIVPARQMPSAADMERVIGGARGRR